MIFPEWVRGRAVGPVEVIQLDAAERTYREAIETAETLIADAEVVARAYEEAIEVLRETTEALNDAIVVALNDGAGWLQEDYDEWHDARARAEALLASIATPTPTKENE